MPETLTSFTPNFSRELDIESMISAPLVAASKANVVMVTGQTRFLLEYCFTKDVNNVYTPVMIVMSLNKGVVDYTKNEGDPDYVKQVQLTFAMPLLCIVPINSLVVERVSIDFDMEITSAIPKESNSANGTENKVTDNVAKLNGKIRGPLDPREGGRDRAQYKPQVSNRLKVSLNAGPLPLPTGVLTILDLYTKSIQPVAATSALPPKKANNHSI